jgi:hypothetical protein
MMNRNPVMLFRAKLTIFYNANQACRGGGYLREIPACLIHLAEYCSFCSGRHDRVTVAIGFLTAPNQLYSKINSGSKYHEYPPYLNHSLYHVYIINGMFRWGQYADYTIR